MMKKFISLALALVMVFSMATMISASGGRNSIPGNNGNILVANGIRITSVNNQGTITVTLTVNAESANGIITILQGDTVRASIDTATVSISDSWNWSGSGSSSNFFYTWVAAPTGPTIVDRVTEQETIQRRENVTTFVPVPVTTHVDTVTDNTVLNTQYRFLANQRQLTGPNANFIIVTGTQHIITTRIYTTVTTTYKVVTDTLFEYTYDVTYDVWSDNTRTLVGEVRNTTITPTVLCENEVSRTQKGKPVTVVSDPVVQSHIKEPVTATSNPLPNGTERNFPVTFADARLADNSFIITYNGNNNNGKSVLVNRVTPNVTFTLVR